MFSSIFGANNNNANAGAMSFPKTKGVDLSLDETRAIVAIYTLSDNNKQTVINLKTNQAWDITTKQCYFEVTVLDPGAKGTIAIGLSKNEKDLTDRQPGWEPGTFGYHADDGIGFNSGNVTRGFGPIWAKNNSTVGCGVDFSTQTIFFVLPDGTKKTMPTDTMTEFPKKFYPMLGMHSYSERVFVNFGTRPFVHSPFKKISLPTTFNLNFGSKAQLTGNNLTISTNMRESVQADTYFPKLNTVLPYYEVAILALKVTDTMSVGFSDQLFNATEMVGSMKNSFGYFSDGSLGFNYSSAGNSERFAQNDVIGCGLAYDSFNQRRVFVTRNGKFLGYINKRVSGGMDCFPTMGFSGSEISVRFNFGTDAFLWELSEWPKVDKTCYLGQLPDDALNIIVEYAAHSVAFTSLCVAQVNKKFNGFVTKNNPLWRQFYYETYPEQNPNLKVKNWQKFYKARYVAMKKTHDPHPIEGCNFGYTCPLLLENLESTDPLQRHCNKCGKDVYIVSDMDALKQHVSLGRCVAYRIDDGLEEMGEEPYEPDQPQLE